MHLSLKWFGSQALRHNIHYSGMMLAAFCDSNVLARYAALLAFLWKHRTPAICARLLRLMTDQLQ
jgi:hypothetical protein